MNNADIDYVFVCPKCGSTDIEITNHYEDWIFECLKCHTSEIVNTEEILQDLFPDWVKR